MPILLGIGAFAQQKMNKSTEHAIAKADHSSNHLMIMNGKMMMIKNGKTTMMEKGHVINHGTKVMKDGTLKTKNGKTINKTIKLKEGKMIYMNGKMGKM